MASKSVRYIILTAKGPLGQADDGAPRIVNPETETVPTFTEKQATELAHTYSHPGTKGRPARTDILPVK